MKKLGVVGGFSWHSTLEYYRLLNALFAEQQGQDHSLDFVLSSKDGGEFQKLIAEGNEPAAIVIVQSGLQEVTQAGAEIAILTANGLHRFYDELQSQSSIPILHIAEATAAAVQQAGLKKAGLLGIRPTMESTFYPEKLAAKNVETLIPTDTDKQTIDSIIFDELIKGQFTEESRARYLDVIQRLEQAGAEGVILGCTEIPLLISQKDCALPLFPTTEIHCRAALQACLS